ncbi:MAG TPA: sialidase family protein, partial [Myxococcales bacterium]|nr:sialidase family protein [Myxococcales bacterium]
PPVDAGTPPPDAGTPLPDAGTPPPDAGTPPQTGLLFGDTFARTAANLGASWTVVTGAFIVNNHANSDRDALDRATVAGIICADCRIDAQMVNFGGGESMLELRGTATDHYALALTTNGTLQLRRYHGTVATVLGSAASGIIDLTNWASFTFSVQGSNPVTLTASVNGVEKLSATDTSASQLDAAGSAGIAATAAGILFRDFTLNGVAAGTPPPADPPPDAGTPTEPPPDAGTPEPPPTGTKLTVTTTFRGTAFDLQAVDPGGTAYGVPIGGDNSQVYASTDGRSWTHRGSNPTGNAFFNMTALADGTLLADTAGGTRAMARSTDHGATWHNVLNLGSFRSLTPHNWAQMNGTVYFLEYQTFTNGATPIRIWASTDDGVTWTARFTFTTSRHGHGLLADPQRGVLWAFFGDTDPQCAVQRSTDGGFTWTKILGQQPADIVDATLLSDGSILAGQDISFQPDFPHVAKITATGKVTDFVTLPAASYSTHALSIGGYVAGVTREVDNDVTPANVTNGSLWGSGDGVTWNQLLTVPRLNADDDVRVDVYWELPTGELVVNVKDASGFGGDGRGYLLLKPTLQ